MKIDCPHCKKLITPVFTAFHGPHDGFYQSLIGPKSDYRTVECPKCKRKSLLDFGGDR